tara:strand:- start:7501 stop:8214 length:714 start_codon:yes stop_codon:yes gene_type:complete
MNTQTIQSYIGNSKAKKYGKNPLEMIRWLEKNLPNDKIIMGTGFGPPGIVLIDMLFSITSNISIFYVDTGFLFDQTYELRNKLQDRYGFEFLRFSSEITTEDQDVKFGEKLWESDPDSCCKIRKVVPLKSALESYDYWITGIRRKQTQTRSEAELIEFESRFDVIKINPLLNWSHDEVWEYIRLNELPYNSLHDKKYPSIGCKQCTSPVLDGEDDRAGRWKGLNKTECGIHKLSDDK